MYSPLTSPSTNVPPFGCGLRFSTALTSPLLKRKTAISLSSTLKTCPIFSGISETFASSIVLSCYLIPPLYFLVLWKKKTELLNNSFQFTDCIIFFFNLIILKSFLPWITITRKRCIQTLI